MKVLYVHLPLAVQSCRHHLASLLILGVLLFFPVAAEAARVLIVGDLKYALVADVSREIQLTLRSTVKEYALPDVKGRLRILVEQEQAQVVVALGADAVAEALRLPPAIAVVYGLVVVPPSYDKGNVTGVYMSPPVNEYAAMVRRYLPSLARFSVVGSQRMLKSLLGGEQAHVNVYHASSSSELVTTVNRLVDTRAVLLLPDPNLLTAPVMSNLYLFSFRNNIPLLGVSEASVKQGALFALVFDHKMVSRQIGEKVQAILNGEEVGEIPDSPPRRYNLYINNNTAQKMGIGIPGEMLGRAKRVYQ